jgi:uncharacterized protein YcaQ
MSSKSEGAQTISKTTARKLFLACQDLYPPRTLREKQGVIQFMERVRSIQFDPINVVGRNPDLVLQSRVKNFRPQMLDDLLYHDRKLFDNWDKMASISIMEDWPYFSRRRARMKDVFDIRPEVVISLAPRVLEQIKQKGPQSSLDFKDDEKTDWAWGPTKVTRAALEGLYAMGRLGVHHRINNRRYFDLIENLLPEDVLHRPDPNQTLEEYQTWHVLHRVKAMGLAHPNAGEQWGGIQGVKSALRKQIIQKAVEEGDLLEIHLEKTLGDVFYLHQDHKPLLDLVQEKPPPTEAALIAPLDNLLWDRKSLVRLFDFEYAWEVYKPKNQRQYGYYVLPVLYGDRFIARLNPGFNKNTGEFTVQDWWWEEDVPPDEEMIEALKRCLGDFLAYLNAENINFSNRLLKKGNLGWLEDLN